MNSYAKRINENKLAYFIICFAIMVLCFSITSVTKGFNVFSDTSSKEAFVFTNPDTGEQTVCSSQEELDEMYDSFYMEQNNSNSKGVMSSASDDLTKRASSTGNLIGSSIVNNIVANFSPTFESWNDLEVGKSIQAGGKKSSDKSTLEVLQMSYSDFKAEMPVAAMIFNAARIIGISFATFFVIVNLVICIFGQAQAIRTNVVRILVMYAISLFSISIAYKLLLVFTDIMNNIWTLIVTSGVLGQASITLSWGIIVSYVLPLIGSTVGIFTLGPAGALIGLILFIMVIWKPIKGFFRMYCQMIENYLIYILLLLMFPATVSTIIAPSTSGIFKSYMRMVFSQTITLLVTSLLMKAFVHFLINGTWFAGISNFIACLAFLKMSQSIQNYIATMGINTAQASGNFASAVGRGFLTSLRDSLSSWERFGNMVGHDLKGAGLAMNNERLFNAGAALYNPVQRALQGREAFNSTIHEAFSDQIKMRNGGIGSYPHDSVATGKFNEYSSYQDAVNRNLPHSYDNAMLGGYNSNGNYINGVFNSADEIGNIKQYENGQVIATSSDETHSAIFGSNGNLLADNVVLSQDNLLADSANPEADGSFFFAGNKGYDKLRGQNAVTTPYDGMDVDIEQLRPLSLDDIGRNHIDNESAMLAKELIKGTEDSEGAFYRYSYTVPEGQMNRKTYDELKGLKYSDKGIRISNGKAVHIFEKKEHSRKYMTSTVQETGRDVKVKKSVPNRPDDENSGNPTMGFFN